MSTKDEKGTAVAAMATQQKEEKKETKKLTPEQLQKQLQESISKFQGINQVIDDRQTFIDKKEVLKGYLEEVTKEDKEGNFESKVCKISLQDANSYRSENAISITNTIIIKEFIAFVINKIDLKVAELETRISF